MPKPTGSGPGTDVCGACAGPKEKTRRGSVRCRACDNGSRGKVRTYRLSITVDEATWTALSKRADAAGMSVYKMGARLVADAVSDPADTLPIPEVPATIPDAASLARAVLWMQNQGLTKPPSIKTKSALVAWCRTQGFDN